MTQEIEQVKSNKDAVQERFDKLSNKLSDLKLSRTELTSLQRFEKNDLERLEDEKATLIKEQSTLELLMEQKESSLQKVDITVLEGQLKTANQEKTDLNQGLIRLKFELEDLEGQSEDILSHLDQARKQNEELIRNQAKAEAEKEKITDVLRRLLTSLTEEYQMSFDEANHQGSPSGKFSSIGRTSQRLGKIYTCARSSKPGCC